MIDLLVAIALIAILAAMLLLTLTSAKPRAKVINRTNNYRDRTVVATMYASDNNFEYVVSHDCVESAELFADS